jgi:hypothetical protein
VVPAAAIPLVVELGVRVGRGNAVALELGLGERPRDPRDRRDEGQDDQGEVRPAEAEELGASRVQRPDDEHQDRREQPPPVDQVARHQSGDQAGSRGRRDDVDRRDVLLRAPGAHDQQQADHPSEPDQRAGGVHPVDRVLVADERIDRGR